jgi:hypothetical protein
MPRGGPRPGSGPKRGTKRITEKTRKAATLEAKNNGYVLPHEILLRAANGECFKQRKLVITYYKSGPNKGCEKDREWIEEDYWPTVQEQIDAAKAAASYFAPRLATQTVKTDETTATALTAVMKALAEKLPG